MIQIAICEDEENIREYLRTLISKQNMECEITEFESGEGYLQSDKEFDLLCLDVELNTEISGLELAKLIREQSVKKQPLIIFVTGHKEYVFDAFDVDAFHFLIKPISKEKFTVVFQKAISRIELSHKNKENTIHIQSTTINKVFVIDEIYYAESQNHKVILHTKAGIVEYYGKISDLEIQLQGQFFRIHKGYLVNMSYIDRYSKTEVFLTNKEVLPLSKYKFADFVKAYLRFME